jgi:hypothetical protein
MRVSLPLGLSSRLRARHLGFADEPLDHSAAGLAAARRNLSKAREGVRAETQVDEGATAGGHARDSGTN